MRRLRTATLTAASIVYLSIGGCGGGGGGQPTGGIHAKLAYSEGGGLRVVEVPPGGAADLAGLQVNDVIISINGTSVRELDYQTIVEKLRGRIGSNVQLEVFRGGEVIPMSVTRQAYSR